MAYYGFQGIYTKSPTYRHPDGTISKTRPARIPAWHDACAYAAFDVDTSREGWGSWHHGLGISWSPGRYSMDDYPCEVCGEAC